MSHRGKYGDKVQSRDWRKGHPETVPPGDSSHIQLPKPDNIVDAKKCMLKGAWYGCLLRGFARALQIQRRMLAANYWTERGVPNRGVSEGTEGIEGVCNPIGRTTIPTNKTPLPPPPSELPGTKPSTKEYSTQLQLGMLQRMALSGISERKIPCSYEGYIDDPV